VSALDTSLTLIVVALAMGLDLVAGRQPSRRDLKVKKGRQPLGGVDTYRIHKMMAARVTTAR
jgi:hypothetical protein